VREWANVNLLDGSVEEIWGSIPLRFATELILRYLLIWHTSKYVGCRQVYASESDTGVEWTYRCNAQQIAVVRPIDSCVKNGH